jgi:hypothetical protein
MCAPPARKFSCINAASPGSTCGRVSAAPSRLVPQNAARRGMSALREQEFGVDEPIAKRLLGPALNLAGLAIT